jgi:hypothetical protein
MELKSRPICGDHLVDNCNCLDYLRDITSAAEKLIQLAKEREELSK